jgi:hypothetical protein
MDSGVFVGQEAKAEMARSFAVESESIHTLGRISSKEILKEQI